MKVFLKYLFLGIVFPLLVQYVFYYRFLTNYTEIGLDEKSFTSFYGQSVFKSRKLGQEMHLWVYHRLSSVEKLKNFKSESDYGKRFHAMYPNGDHVFYLTYFLTACGFTILTSLIILLIFDHDKIFSGTRREKNLAICFLVFMIGFTQFAITPYDNLSYFFLAAGILLFLRFMLTKNWIYYIGLISVIVTATTNRESSSLIVSAMIAILYSLYALNWRWIKYMLMPVLAFVIPYFLLKAQSNAGLTGGNTFFVNFAANSVGLIGIVFALFVFYFIYQVVNVNNKTLIHRFLFFSLPYLIIIPMVGLMIEFRLWMPVFETGIILSFLDIQQLKSGSFFELQKV